MSATSAPPGVRPFTTHAEVTTGKRRLALNTVTVLASVFLAVYCSRTFLDERLVAIYLVAAGIHLLSAVFMALRLSATPEPPHGEPPTGTPSRRHPRSAR
ncbi:MAG: hypothetical protein ACRDPJ_03960 [Nocardioidaceae bacterium]